MIDRYVLRNPIFRCVYQMKPAGQGIAWILASLGFQLVSWWTDVVGLTAAIGLMGAWLLASGLQAVVSMLGYRLTYARDMAFRHRLLIAWTPVAVISIVFSYTALDASFERVAIKLVAPTVAKASL